MNYYTNKLKCKYNFNVRQSAGWRLAGAGIMVIGPGRSRNTRSSPHSSRGRRIPRNSRLIPTRKQTKPVITTFQHSEMTRYSVAMRDINIQHPNLHLIDSQIDSVIAKLKSWRQWSLKTESRPHMDVIILAKSHYCGRLE